LRADDRRWYVNFFGVKDLAHHPHIEFQEEG